MIIRSWFPLGLTGLISLQSKGLSRVLSSTTVQKHQFFYTQLLYGPALTSTHDYWKNHSTELIQWIIPWSWWKKKRKEFEVIRIEMLWGRTLPICFWLLCRVWSCSGVARKNWRLELAAALGWKAGATLTRTLSKEREGNPFSSKAYCLLSSSCLQSSL